MNIYGTIAFALLLILCGLFLWAWLRTRRVVAVLTVEIDEAREKQRINEKWLTQRSQLDSVKDEFIATVSHELRTPLTSIRGALGLLSAGLMGSLDSKGHHILRIAVTNTDRLIRLINDILDLERIESGREALQLRRCSLGDLVQHAIETMSVMALESGVTLLFSPAETVVSTSTTPLGIDRRSDPIPASAASPPPASLALPTPPQRRTGEERRRQRGPSSGPTPVFFDGDPDRILQVLTNLISNAIKFSPRGTTVTVHLAASSDIIHLRVSDQGRGIPQDKLEKVFERFEQVDASDSRQKGGTGLGLAICRSIIHQHAGAIWAQRNPSSGVSLCIDLPRINRSTDQLPANAENVVVTPPPTDGSIIVCDDDPGVRTVVAEHLRRQGYTVLEASSGEETLDLAARPRIGAILLDLYMPALTGWETLQRLKSSPSTANIPVVILSVLSPAERPSINSDAQGWVQKPFNENLLIAEISRVLQSDGGLGHVHSVVQRLRATTPLTQ